MASKLKKLLFIDDNDIDLMVNSRIINLSGLVEEVTLFNSGISALRHLKEIVNETEKWPDFILLDIQMPDMNGFEFMEHFKELPTAFINHCKVAMLSSTLDFGDIKKAEANPLVIQLLKKPLFLDELSELIKNSFSLSRS